MSLVDYAKKRRFDKTREPAADYKGGAGGRKIFVVQLHHASHRHYDFRLQVGDTLRSWAVPKGPSFDPKVKRLAAEVEDHPVSYAGFEGDIPAGEYGGGHVARFDGGIWSTEGDPVAQLKKGHLRFELFGDKLKGGWHLIRSGRASARPQWLLVKQQDRYAGDVEADDLLKDVVTPSAKAKSKSKNAAEKKSGRKNDLRSAVSVQGRGGWASAAIALPGAVKKPPPATPPPPQLATLVASPPSDDDWLHEIKWDGYRITAMVADRKVRLWSRNGLEWTRKLPDIVDAVEQLGLRDGVLDGELIARRGAQADFPALQSTLSGDRNDPLVYVLFDLLHVDGVSLAKVALTHRKALLSALIGSSAGHLALSTHSVGNGERAFEAAVREGFEGIVSKRADGAYRGGRGKDWLKSKTQDAEELAVVGYTPPKGSRSGFGSLLLARREGRAWVYAGKVGSGFSDQQLVDLRRRIGRAGGETATVRVPENDTDLRLAKWFAPMFVVDVASRGLGSNGLLRQPSLKAIRLDKEITDMRKPSSTQAKAKPSVRSPAPRKLGASVSSPGKILFPTDGITKQDVADYYAAVMPKLLPEIVGRPLSVIRCPGGIDGGCFFQKHDSAGIEGVDSISIEEKDGGHDDYLVVRGAPSAMALVQSNSLEFHPWGALATNPDRADRLVFDLDPGPGVPWRDVRAAARLIRDLLAGIDLQSFLRTSGGKGLHVVVPLRPPVPWDLAKPFAHAFAESMARMHPDRFVATATKSRRTGRIFIDYLRNGRGATSVASYSLRARPGAPVAMPIAWDALSRITGGDAFTLATVPALLAKRKVDPWDGIEKIRQGLPRLGAPKVKNVAPVSARPSTPAATQGARRPAKTAGRKPASANRARTPDA